MWNHLCFAIVQCVATIAVCSATVSGASPDAGDWPWWRGPNFNGVAAEGQNVPREWSDSQNVAWKVSIPGRGHASPTVVGDRIYLATADEGAQRQGVLCLSRKDGTQLWITPLSQGGFPQTHPKNTHATPTVACDGERLFVTFHHHAKVTLHCLDLDGKELWSRELGAYNPKKYEYGYAPSPLIYGDVVILAADVESGGLLAAYNRESGKRVWRTDRPTSYSFSSPVIANVAGQDQLLISGCEAVASYDPKNGKLSWVTPGTTMATCGTMVWDGDLVFASGGYPKAETICVKGDGSKEVLWKNGQKCYEQSMLATGGYVYAVTDQGVAFCWRGSDGQEMWKERLQGPVSSSPILVGDVIYSTNEAGTTYVFKASPNGYEQLARNQLGEEGFATLAVCGNQIFIRTATGSDAGRQEWLYCISAGQ
ncbi:MAG: PQQ-binding-like beta-propeller repeat protein [Planctomycetaceae bacterium]|nr:PQQ-binding-like beta-propeller repeat protein [Planctomycetaceae bacterium]